MTIHHDKLAYGKLAPTSEDLSEERLAQMLAQLNGEQTEETETEPNAVQTQNSEHGQHKRKI